MSPEPPQLGSQHDDNPNPADRDVQEDEEEEDHDQYLNGMDDLLSFGSPCSHGAGAPSDDSCYSVSGSILTPSGGGGSSSLLMMMSPPAPDSPDWRPLLNAVHMELQENAKLPTFHWNVNRTGSAQNHHRTTSTSTSTSTITTSLRPRISRPYYSTSPSAALFHSDNSTAATNNNNNNSPQQQEQEQQQLPSLMEHFLQKETQSRRHGRHDSYSYSSLNGNNTNMIPGQTATATATATTDATTADPLLAFLHNVDPTPLEEIKRKHTRGYYIPQRRDPLPIPTLLLNTKTASTTTTHPKNQELNDNQQQPQLIVPAAASTPQHLDASSSSLLHDAVATAAAIVKVAAAVDCDPVTGTTEPRSNRPSSSSATTAPPRPGCFAARHAVPIRALQTATTQKSQYGFGRKHVVPSVPAAAPIRTRPSSAAAAAAPRTGAAAAVRIATLPSNERDTTKPSGTAINNNSNSNNNNITTSQQSSSLSRTGSGGGSGDEDDRESSANGGRDAYERKKQRAKNARVRLNESIDRLAIAINLAGTQSHERATLLEEWNHNRSSSSASDGHATLHNNNFFTTTTTCVNIIRECVTTADDAKKWDRPNFVGSAATLIQGMNAQCEALMRELQTVHQELELQRHASRSYPDADDNDDDNHDLFPQHKHSLDDLTVNHNWKRRRRLDGDPNRQPLYDNQETDADRLVFAERTIMNRVASFLEPLSIVRCMRVSKAWKDWGIFSNEPLWQNLAVERFGYFNVRQWRGLLEDHPEPPPLHGDVASTATAAIMAANASSHTAISSTLLYKKMDASNVMPHFRHEGTFLLGEARLPGKVSAWTFLVERSNGETMRSVLRPPGHPGTGPYVSLPVVQLWTVLQNTGIHDEFVVIREQIQTVDASTRRRGEEFKEIDWDERFRKRTLNLDGSQYRASALEKNAATTSTPSFNRELCRLKLFDAVILESNIHATGCSTSSKFVQRSNYTKVFLQIRNGTTVPLVIPFPRESSHLYAF